MQKVVFSFLLIFLFLFGEIDVARAQRDTVASIVNKLRSLQPAVNFDSALFVKESFRVARTDLSDADIEALHTVANGFVNGTDHDKELYLHYSILISLSRKEFYRAIDYAKQNMQQFEQNGGPNKNLLQQTFLQLLRAPYRNSDRIGEGFQLYNDILSKSIAKGNKAGIVNAYYVLSGFYRTIGLIDVAIYHLKKGIKVVDTSDYHVDNYFTIVTNMVGINTWINFTGILGEYYNMKGDYKKALAYTRSVLEIANANGFAKQLSAYHYKNIAVSFLELNKLDSAFFYLNQGEKNASIADRARLATMLQVKCLYYLKKRNFVAADSVIAKCWELINLVKMNAVTPAGIVGPDYYSALIRIEQGRYAAAASLLKQDIERIKGVRIDLLRDYKLLGETYEKIGDQKQAKEYFVSYIRLQDSLLIDQSRFRTVSFEMEEQLAEKGKAIDQLQTDNKISRILWMFSLGIVLLLIVLSFLINQRYRAKRKANTALENTLAELKNTQSQLIQSEKMASLGELTAGIAHEIQNPLNFVNNFSDVNTELLTEMKEELNNGNIDDAKAIADDVIANEQKINHHGKRADTIVKGMLQHSRSSSGVKEPTDINALADEYLRLAYHGLRAKDKSFNATIKTDFDESVGMVSAIPQDIGRVILNLIINAFYAVDEKKRQTGAEYEPTVSVSTKKHNDKVEISVKDNGSGIPSKILDKIFQPFFTTKPTGEGTGLGLSLSYDIVKAHGGDLNVKPKDGGGTIFTILLKQ